MSAYGSTLTLEYTDNTVYSQQRMYSNGTIEPACYTLQKSYTVIVSTPTGPATARITVYPMTARPVSSTGTVTVSTFNVTLPIGQCQVVFCASVADNASSMDFMIKNLVPWAWYEVLKDSVPFVAAHQLDAAAAISFRNSEWDGTHRFAVKQVPDTVAPVISDIRIAAVTDSSVEVHWTTNEPADGRIEYGERGTYGSFTGRDSSLLTSHTHRITELIPKTGYHFRILSADSSGNSTVSGDYAVMTTGSGGMIVVPNPYIKGQSRTSSVTFGNLDGGAVIRIYTLAGQPVTVITHDAGAGTTSEQWDVSGVAGGIYLYTILSNGATTKGKLGIIK
jgi:hypothetical protein